MPLFYPNPLPVANGGTGVIGSPSFLVTLNSTQSVTTNTLTKVQFDTKLFDNGTYFDTITNFRYTPLVAGTYFITASILYIGGNVVTKWQTSLYKNGSAILSSSETYNTTVSASGVSSTFCVSLNGSTDYIELFGLVASASTPQFFGSGVSFLSGSRIGA